jgi:hypothetical protein
MSIDFGALVLGPAMAAFAWPITVTPLASQPGQAAYAARGSFDAESQSIPLEDGSELQSVRIILGIRLNEFPIAPRQGDRIAVTSPTDTQSYFVDRITPDGQGGAEMALKKDSK